MIRNWTKRALHKLGYSVTKTRGRYAADGFSTVHQPRFLQDPRFGPAYARGIEASLGVDPDFEWRVHTALWAASRALQTGGDFIECGVNAGFISSAIMHYLRWESVERNFYLVDTFSGPDLDQYSEAEVGAGRVQVAQTALSSGSYVVDLDRVRANYRRWPRAILVPGTVPQVLASIPAERVAFVHIDLNCAAPEAAALEFFWSRLSQGGLILLDDYAYANCEHQGDLLDQTAHRLGTTIMALPTGQGLLLK